MIRCRSASIVIVLAAGCSSLAPGPRQDATDPDSRLAAALEALARARSAGPSNDGWLPEEEVIVDSGRLRNDVERLAVEFPGHVPTLAANARLAWEAGEREKAGAYADRALALAASEPDVVVIRARVALADGNVSFARKLIENQQRLHPDDAELHETLAAVLYFGRDLAGACAQLDAADRLGAPRWRVAYHRGLIAEARGDQDEAAREFQEAIDGNSTFVSARERLRGIGSIRIHDVKGSSPDSEIGPRASHP